MGEKIGLTITNIIKALPGFLKSLGQIAGTFVMIAGAADVVAQAMGGWQSVIYLVGGLMSVKLAVGLYALGAAVAAIVPTIWTLGAALMATPLGWFMAAIALIAGAIYLIYRNWEPIKAFFVGLWEGVKSAFLSVYNFIAGKLGAILAFAGKVIDTVNGAFPSGTSLSDSGYDSMGMATGFSADTALPTGSGAKADVSGTLNIKIDQEGRARVAQAKSNNPGVDYAVYTGMSMAM